MTSKTKLRKLMFVLYVCTNGLMVHKRIYGFGLRKGLISTRQKLAHATLLLTALVVGSSSLFSLLQFNKAAAQLPMNRAGGSGVMFYSENDTSPVSRLRSSGTTTWGSEVSSGTSRNPLQVVVKKSPRMLGEWFAAEVDSSGNLQVLRTTDSGTSWSDTSGANVTWPVSVGGTGTTQRFDMEFEHNSGDLILAYSKDATTNEIATRQWTGSAWSTETTFDPGGTDSVVTWIELAQKQYSDELALGYVTNDSTATITNLGAALWSGSALGNATASGDTGQCDQTAATPDGVDKCMDINYESASGFPVLSWGIQSAGNTTNTVRSTRWNGSAWSTTTISIGASGDDVTQIDCASNPNPNSNEIACGSIGNGGDDVQGWTIVGGALGVAGLNLDAASHLDAAGRQMVAITYVVKGSNARAVLFGSDAGATDNQIDWWHFTGTAWTAGTSLSLTGNTEENMKAFTNPYDSSEAVFLVGNLSSDLFAVRVNATTGTPTLAAENSGSALEATMSTAASAPFDMDFEPNQQPPQLNQTGSIWENDDGAADTNTQLAAGNASISGVRKGERLTLRTQIKATNGPLNYQPVSLFYDRNDGIWNRVDGQQPAVTGSGSGCTSADFTCSLIYGNTGGSRNIIDRSSMAIDKYGNPWIAYKRANSANDLYVANYVGTGGTCTDNSAWNCTSVETTNDIGTAPDIAIAPDGSIYIAHYDTTNGNLRVCTNTGSWSCVAVEATNDIGNQPAIAIDSYGVPWVAYRDSTNGALRVARYVSASGTGCAGGSTAWSCASVEDDADCVGAEPDIIQKQSGQMMIIYEDASNADCVSSFNEVRTATYVGAGGTGCAGSSTVWTCADLDTVATKQPHAAVGPDGSIWVAENRTSASDARVCQYTSSWSCTDYWTSNSPGTDSAIAIAPDGNPWIVSREDGSDDLVLARYVGGGGGSGCASSDWTCTTIISTDDNGYYPTLVFDSDGTAWISYMENTNDYLYIAKLQRGGEFNLTQATAGGSGDALSESHADMSTVSDTSNRDDADCISGTWSNGKWSESHEISGLSVSGKDYCTEVAFTIDTTNAVAGTTYRFIVSYEDVLYSSSFIWRGLTSVSSGAYGTLTMESNYGDTSTLAKDSQYKLANCNQDTAWGCDTIAATGRVGAYGKGNSLVFDDNGTAWAGTFDDTNDDMIISKYVGAGGNCDSGYGGSDAWNCTLVDSTVTINGTNGVEAVSGAIDPAGNPWFAYADASTNVRVARYVGSGGTGCASTEWKCYAVDTTANDTGQNPTIGFDKNGIAWVGYGDVANTTVRIARFVGTGGANCSDTAWNCTAVDAGMTSDPYYGIVAMDTAGNPWIFYHNNVSASIEYARYVGSGGTNCSTTDWTCGTVVDNANTFEYISATIDASNNVWLHTYDASNGTEVVCRYTSSWACTDVYNVTSAGFNSNFGSIAIAPDGNPWISFMEINNGPPATSLVVAKYVGSGGSNCLSSAWTCTTVENNGAGYLGMHSSIAFDAAGIPWVTSFDDSNGNFRIAKMHASPFKLLSAPTAGQPRGRNARLGEARYYLTPGKSPMTNGDGDCDGVADSEGYCALFSDDGNLDGITTTVGERAVFTLKQKLSSNSILPSISWVGRSTLNPNQSGAAGDIVLQVYRFGSTNAWETLVTDSTSAACSTDRCMISAVPGGTASEYFESSGGSYYVYIRVYQEAHTAGFTFRTDELRTYLTSSLMRHGKSFQRNVLTPDRTDKL